MTPAESVSGISLLPSGRVLTEPAACCFCSPTCSRSGHLLCVPHCPSSLRSTEKVEEGWQAGTAWPGEQATGAPSASPGLVPVPCRPHGPGLGGCVHLDVLDLGASFFCFSMKSQNV